MQTEQDEEEPQPKRYQDCWLGGQQVKTFVGTFENALPMHYAPRDIHIDRSVVDGRAAKFKLLKQVLEEGEHPGESSKGFTTFTSVP